MSKPATVYLPASLLAQCDREVARTFPMESGGVLMGARIDNDHWRVDHVVGPGPAARHSRYRFSPDLPWQHDRIAERFHATGGASTYLGDWHSHPGARHGRLSHVDERALGAIIDSEAAQCPAPLMMILWGGPDAWQCAMWRARLEATWWGGTRVRVRACVLADRFVHPIEAAAGASGH